jgi:hypothetical protein
MACCHDDSQPPTPTEELLQREKEQRMQAEANRDKETASKEQWQGLTAVSVIGAIILLITGTILGSRTKHDAQHHE